uniref:Uncharacterized protein n=1 Tax=Leptobrachium leishanense TaxID=445787 RepID=A0A8C5Q6P5_9ANUR
MLVYGFVVLVGLVGLLRGCQLPQDWRPQTEACRAELVETILFAKVLAIHKDSYSVYNYLPWQYDSDLFYSAEIELVCDQGWGSMLEVPTGSRLNLTGLGYLPCQSYTVMENNSYYFFLRMDENYNLLPHGVNFQDAIFPDTPENHRIFASLFQFSNCSAGVDAQIYTPDWDVQEDHRRHRKSLLISRKLEKDVLRHGHRVHQSFVEYCDGYLCTGARTFIWYVECGVVWTDTLLWAEGVGSIYQSKAGRPLAPYLCDGAIIRYCQSSSVRSNNMQVNGPSSIASDVRLPATGKDGIRWAIRTKSLVCIACISADQRRWMWRN